MATRGLDCVLYRNTGSYASPVWNEVDTIRDETVNDEKRLADGSTRRSRFVEQVTTLRELSLEFSIKKDVNNADWVAFSDAYWNNTLIEVLVCDSPISGDAQDALRFTAEVVSMGEDRGLESVVFSKVRLIPSAIAEHGPELFSVSS